MAAEVGERPRGYSGSSRGRARRRRVGSARGAYRCPRPLGRRRAPPRGGRGWRGARRGYSGYSRGRARRRRVGSCARCRSDVHGLLAGGERLLVPAEVGEAVAEVIHAHREVGQEGVGSGLREAPIGPRPLGWRRAPPRGGRDWRGACEVIQAHREVGQEGVGSGLREAPMEVHGLWPAASASSRRPRLESMAPGCSGSSRGRARRRRVASCARRR